MRRNNIAGIVALVFLIGIGHGVYAEHVYDSQGKRNPFMPLVTSDGRLVKLEDEVEKDIELSLEGIIFDKNGMSFALVSGEVARVGDFVGAHQVLRIDKDKVIFVKDGQTFQVELTKEE
jgi:hypothetical protein